MTHYRLIHFFLWFTLFVSCQQKRIATPMDLEQEAVIPKPVHLEATGSSFLLEEGTTIFYDTPQLEPTANHLAKALRIPTGFSLPVQPTTSKIASGNIYLKASNKDSVVGEEGYQLKITEDFIEVDANATVGVFRAIQTLKQLFPPEIVSSQHHQKQWEIATGTITDYPEFAYRGVMLDVARHFFEVEDIKRLIDLISLYKINMLHLHLTDDQGWRIAITSWPNLTAHGGKTEVGGTEGGFYTQEQYKDIVSYAQERFITIIPEIDMPGHTNAALASYAELNCDDKAPELYTGTKVGFSTLCTHKEITYTFIDDVIRELAAITPGPYIHIGGDESHSTVHKDYVYFIDSVQNIVNKHGKQMIGWDEISDVDLQPTTITQFWVHPQKALKAAQQKSKIIMSPAKNAYLDMKYDSITPLGLDWAGYIDVDTAYTWDLSSYVEGIGKEDILGIEAPLWTETVKTMEDIEYMIFPRLLGYAEIGWTPKALRNWKDYKVRLQKQKERLEILNVNYYPSKRVWD